MKKLVLTGAAGRLGSYLREPLSQMCDSLISTDWTEDLGKLYPGETYVKADLGDLDAMEAVLEGADMVVHFGAIGDEAAWDKILHSNIIGAYNVWEAAARKASGVGRLIGTRSDYVTPKPCQSKADVRTTAFPCRTSDGALRARARCRRPGGCSPGWRRGRAAGRGRSR